MIKLDISRVDLVRKISSPDYVGVEVGCFKGHFSKEIADFFKTLYVIDVWRPLGDEYKDESNHSSHHNAYAEAMKNIEGLENKVIMIRADSLHACDIFNDASLDFVYIDANHAYDFVKQDIKLWYPKVKKGGFLLGHDYLKLDWDKDSNFNDNKKDKNIYFMNDSSVGAFAGVFGVNPAVDEFCKDYDYELTLTNEWFGTWMIQK